MGLMLLIMGSAIGFAVVYQILVVLMTPAGMTRLEVLIWTALVAIFARMWP